MNRNTPKKDIHLTIDGFPVSVPKGTTILEAARKINVRIPTLCDHPGLRGRAVCRVCVVECDGRGRLAASCASHVSEGMTVVTNSLRILDTRRMILELLLANHPQECLTCIRGGTCELQALAVTFGIRSSPFHRIAADCRPPEAAGGVLVRNTGKCVKCGRCVEVCQEEQSVRAIDTSFRSCDYEISTPYGEALGSGPCVFCGRCAEVCPVGAIYEHDQTPEVRAALESGKPVTAQIEASAAPAVRAGLGLAPGSVTPGTLVTALKRMGFAAVYDAGLFAGASLKEEARELLDRINIRRNLPMISACSPGGYDFVEKFYGGLTGCLSRAKSPQALFGAAVKERVSRLSGADSSAGRAVSFVSCLAKKFEPQWQRKKGAEASGFALTPRELVRMIRIGGIDMRGLGEIPFDGAGFDSGADSAAPSPEDGLAAALSKALSGFDASRGRASGIQQAEITFNGSVLKVLAVYGLANARIVLDSIREGECSAAYVKIFNCPAGCAGGPAFQEV